jgi:hypothetical protein
MTACIEGEESYSAFGESFFTSGFISAARGQVVNSTSDLISLDDIMIAIDKYIAKERVNFSYDFKMTPHLYETQLEDNSGEFFFINPSAKRTVIPSIQTTSTPAGASVPK